MVINFRKNIQRWFTVIIAVCLVAGIPLQEAFATAAPVEKKTSKRSQSSSKTRTAHEKGKASSSKGKSSSSKGKAVSSKGKSTSSKGKATSSKGSAAPVKSKAELTKLQKSAQEEVKKTREEIQKNDREIKKNLSELSRLEDEIAISKKETQTLSAEVNKLSTKIGNLEASIAKNTKELARIRTEYLKAVKKMRVSRKKNSGMAFLFSAKNLAQADRRMRYLKEFSEWKDEQTKQINAKVATLKAQNEELLHAKSDKDIMLGREMKAQKKLTDQKGEQDIIIKDLQANGEALRNHLAKKQSEVNALNNQVAAVIADEQRKAEAARKKAETERLAAERKAAERKAKKKEAAERKVADEKAAAERLAQEKAAKEKADKEIAKKETAKKETAKKDVSKKETSKKEPTKNETLKKETNKKEVTRKDSKVSEGELDYAKARNRKPRDSKPSNKDTKQSEQKKEVAKQSAPKKEETKKESPKNATPKKEESQSGNFASMKGSLPRPVSGAFRVTGKFGRHSLPDLPNVTYDNPGIDVEVAKGASVSSVYQGVVSGVYALPGFSTVIIVSHGDYYTVYGNLASASVKVGDSIKQGQSLGRLIEDADNPGHSSLHFEVWKGREKVNPSNWIK